MILESEAVLPLALLSAPSGQEYSGALAQLNYLMTRKYGGNSRFGFDGGAELGILSASDVSASTADGTASINFLGPFFFFGVATGLD